jgi:hypothetical protein
VPAVLRPTEKPVRSSPPKNRAKFVDVDGHARRSSTDLRESAGSLVEGTEANGTERPLKLPHVLRRMVTEEWTFRPASATVREGEVSGPPSRNHWKVRFPPLPKNVLTECKKPDGAVTSCDFLPCARLFSLFLRRHHCRRCGNIFCGEHSPHVVPLDAHARFSTSNSGCYRACDDCWKDYRVWETERVRRENGEGGDDGEEGNGGVQRGSMDIPGAVTKKKGVMGVIAQSVPRDWSWSTF